MAQYFQVLSQAEKPSTEELQQFYPNIVENQTPTVQYLISPNDRFPTQQILVSSSDQLMVVEGQPRRVIVDQSQVSFQSQQYVLQESTVEFQESQGQQVYYMDENVVQQTEPLQIESTVQSPIVLNHQLPGTGTRPQVNSGTSQKVMSSQRPNQMSSVQQPIRQQRPVVPPQHQVLQNQARSSVKEQSQASPNNAQEKLISSVVARGGVTIKSRIAADISSRSFSSTADSDSDKSVTLDNGMTLARFKQIMAEKKQDTTTSASNQERLETSVVFPSTVMGQKRKYSRPSVSRSARGGRNAKSARSSVNTMNFSVAQSNTNTTSVPQQRFLAQRHVDEEMLQQQTGTQNRFVQQQQAQQPQNIMQPQQNVQQPLYIVPPRSQNQHQQCSLPAYVPSSQIQQIIDNTPPVSNEYSDSIRMLVLLASGEQRLITFTLPKEQCSIQEILDQVGVPILPDTKIECMETNTNGINYIVTVGLTQYSLTEVASEELTDTNESIQANSSMKVIVPESPPRAPTPEPAKELPKLVPGRLAVCGYCGYLSEDFNKCLRCKRKLPDDIKSVPSDQLNAKKDNLKNIQEKKLTINIKTNGAPRTPVSAMKKKTKPKVIDPEPIILTLSSDEEDENQKVTHIASLKMIDSNITLSEVKKEPSMTDIQQYDKEHSLQGGGGGGDEGEEDFPNFSTSIFCRIVRIGSYRFVPEESVIINSTSVTIKIPHPNDKTDVKTIVIDKQQIVKVLVNFQKMLPVIFYYVMPSVGQLIRDQLDMKHGSEYYFDPLSKEEAYKRITFLPEVIADDIKSVFKQIYGKPVNIMDELTAKEANNILLKTCPKEITKAVGSSTCFSEVKQLLIYPAGKGGLSINTEDYLCLAQDQFLNDVIIDFYLKYLILNLPQEQQAKVHIFSTFFYKRLTTKPLKASRRSHPSEVDSTLTAAQKRHARVKKWTKNVNLFEKDFIIIPINENCHWFLAIICFPRLDGTYTFDGKPIKLEPKNKKKKLEKSTSHLGNITISQIKTEKKENVCEDGDVSDKDEAEGDDSELDSEEELDEPEPETDNNQPIKQPCVLIFDSLAGASRSRVVATLRDYLTCEYKAKINSERIFNKDSIKCACPKVPQQTNFTDCGLYLLQYVESFFMNPIKDYRLPITTLKTWFEELTVTKKREDISNLIKDLMIKYGKDPYILPEMMFPTLNGKLVPRIDEEMEEEDEDEEEMLNDELHYNDDSHECCSFETKSEVSHNSEAGESESSIRHIEESVLLSVKPSNENKKQNDSFDEQLITVIKPDLSEIKTQTNRDTLSYLKAKRIIRHKSSDSSDSKKVKLSQFE